ISSSNSRFSNFDVHSLYETDADYGGSVAGDEAWLRIRDLEDLDDIEDIDSVKEEEEKTLARSKQQQQQLYSLYDDHTHLPSKDSIYSLYQSQSQVMPPQRPATYLSDSSTIMRDSYLSSTSDDPHLSPSSQSHPSNKDPHSTRSSSLDAPPEPLLLSRSSSTRLALRPSGAHAGDFFPHRPRTTSHPVDLYKAPPSKIVKAVSYL
ncbi:hypothetical protein HDU99_003121, partial [Rhizoclosmatium hyalinum]